MIYRFKVWFEEDEDIYRVIDINPAASFLDLHNKVLDSIAFNKALPSSFYVSDDSWRKGIEITLEDESGKKQVMATAKIKDFVNDPHQKFLYITDFAEQWTLLIELQSIQNDIKGVNYPFVSKTAGKAPKQNEGTGRFKIVDESEFDEIASKIASKHSPALDEGFDEEAFGIETDPDDEAADDDDEFDESFEEGGEEEHL